MLNNWISKCNVVKIGGGADHPWPQSPGRKMTENTGNPGKKRKREKEVIGEGQNSGLWLYKDEEKCYSYIYEVWINNIENIKSKLKPRNFIVPVKMESWWVEGNSV